MGSSRSKTRLPGSRHWGLHTADEKRGIGLVPSSLQQMKDPIHPSSEMASALQRPTISSPAATSVPRSQVTVRTRISYGTFFQIQITAFQMGTTLSKTSANARSGHTTRICADGPTTLFQVSLKASMNCPAYAVHRKKKPTAVSRRRPVRV